MQISRRCEGQRFVSRVEMCEGFVAVADGRGGVYCVWSGREVGERERKELGSATKKLVEPNLI